MLDKSAPDRDGSGAYLLKLAKEATKNVDEVPHHLGAHAVHDGFGEKLQATLVVGDREGSFVLFAREDDQLTIVFAVGQVPVEKIPNPLIVFMQALAVAGRRHTIKAVGHFGAVVAKLPRFGDPMAQIADSLDRQDPEVNSDIIAEIVGSFRIGKIDAFSEECSILVSLTSEPIIRRGGLFKAHWTLIRACGTSSDGLTETANWAGVSSLAGVKVPNWAETTGIWNTGSPSAAGSIPAKNSSRQPRTSATHENGSMGRPGPSAGSSFGQVSTKVAPPPPRDTGSWNWVSVSTIECWLVTLWRTFRFTFMVFIRLPLSIFIFAIIDSSRAAE